MNGESLSLGVGARTSGEHTGNKTYKTCALVGCLVVIRTAVWHVRRLGFGRVAAIGFDVLKMMGICDEWTRASLVDVAPRPDFGLSLCSDCDECMMLLLLLCCGSG